MKYKMFLQNLLGSKLALVVFILAFITLAGHIAYTSSYPMPYDESYHFGLIQLYSHHLNPLLPGQPAHADQFGAVAREGSYLYHYLMSFPLRLISLFTTDVATQVTALRFVGISLGVATLVLVHALGRRFKLSAVSANLVVLAFAITPIFYDLSAQLNYDNMLIPLALGSFLLAWNVRDQIRMRRLSVVPVAQLACLMLLTSLVKYTYLPLMAGISLYLLAAGIRAYGVIGCFAALGRSFMGLGKAAKLAIIAGFIVSAGLWGQRYGVNIAKYDTPHPQCGNVLSVQQCMNYSAWARNYTLHQQLAQPAVIGLHYTARFTVTWGSAMYRQIYTIVTVRPGSVIFSSVRPLSVIFKLATVVALAAMLVMFPRYFRTSIPWGLLIIPSVLYVATLWAQNFSDYHHLGEYIGVQGRYLLPLLAITYVSLGRAYQLLYHSVMNGELAGRSRLALGQAVLVGSLVRKRARQQWSSLAK